MNNKLDKFFKISERGSNVKTEIIAGLTTFFAMAYIVVTNPNQVTGFITGGAFDTIWNSVYVASILVAVIGTLLYAFYAKLPYAQACGMGLNSFFFVSFILPYIINPLSGSPLEGYKAGLAIILFSGVVFLVLSLTGVRKYIAYNLPPALKVAIPAGIGLFIAFIGLQNSGFVVPNEYTGVAIADFTKGAAVAVPAILALVGFILILVFSNSKMKWLKNTAIISSIIACTALYYICVLNNFYVELGYGIEKK